jgi:hypothetical protein
MALKRTTAVTDVYRKWKQFAANEEESREQHPALPKQRVRGAFVQTCYWTIYTFTCTGTNSGVQRELWRDLAASSAVNLPMSSATFRLLVVWTGV